MSALVVPKTSEAWTQQPPFRVEYFSKHIAQRCLIYFDSLGAAQEFASANTLWNQPCVVESRDMPVTHLVQSYDPLSGYVFWTKHFGDIETARAEFERGKEHALQSGGGFRLVDANGYTAIASFSQTVD